MSSQDPGLPLKPAPAADIAIPGVGSLGFLLCVLVPLAVWFAPLGLAPQTQHGLAIVCFMVVAWMTQAMEFALAGFVGCFLFWALGVVRFNVAFSGFANDTPWFLFAALLLGASPASRALRAGSPIRSCCGSSRPIPGFCSA